MRKLSTYFILLTLLLFSNNSSIGQTIELVENRKTYMVKSHLRLFITNDIPATFEQIINDPPVFHPLQELSKRIKAGQTYWGQFSIKTADFEAMSGAEWILTFPLVLTDINVYAFDTPDNIQFSQSGFFKPLEKRTFAPVAKGNVAKLTLLPNRTYTIFLKLESKRFTDLPEFDIRLVEATEYWTSLNKTKKQNALYLGFVLMMLLYNLILYFFASDRTFLFYSIYLMGIVIYAAYNSGELAQWVTEGLFPAHPQYIFYFKLVPYISLPAYLIFIRLFMDLPRLLPKWDTVYKWLAILAIPWLLIDSYLMTVTNYSYITADRFLILFALSFVGAIFSIIIPLYKTKQRKGYFIIFGMAAMGLGLLFTVWARVQSIGFSTFYFKVGSVLEITAFSLGLAYRRLLSEKEKQKAHFELVKSKLLQEQEQKEAERLKELDRLKSRLYTNITHEFRTPLTVIMGINEQIQGNEKLKKLVHRNSQNLLQLVNQMLDLAKAEEGKLQLHLTHKDIINYLRYLTESFLSVAESNKIRLTFYTEVEQYFMDYDEAKIQHVLHNLLSNALKFTPEGGTVVIHTKIIELQGKPYLSIKIKDNGIGISAKDLPIIFDRFHQLDNSNTRKTGGTGIGLALVKELVTLMEGKVFVESQLSKGSTFTIQLPIKTKLISGTTIQTNQEVKEKSKGKAQPQQTITIAKSSDAVLTLNQKNPIVLVVEDNKDVLAYIKNCLEGNYNFQAAKNGKEGIEKAIAIIPNLIISDVMMPEKDGFELTKTLKQDIRTSHIPIILLTAKATQASKLKGLKHGADAYLMKPFDKNELLIRVEKLIKLRKRLQYYYSGKNKKSSKFRKETIETDFLKEVRQIITAHLAQEDFSVPQIAQALNMSQMQVYRKLKALTGQTPSKYVRLVRMEKAMVLLKTTQLNIAEIAYELGFSDPNYFSRSFQQFYSKTPSSIRKNEQEV